MATHYRYEHKRLNTQGKIIAYDRGNIATSSAQEIQDCLGARFDLQDWEEWTCLADGTLQRTHPPNSEHSYRGTLIVRPIHAETQQ